MTHKPCAHPVMGTAQGLDRVPQVRVGRTPGTVGLMLSAPSAQLLDEGPVVGRPQA
ncbi:hypothetical protein ACFWVB_37055 [Streptomyces microflavus]|uniref:hypothetical protein n=1 Tax=Streptomyces microflavus TaxID=1919 RepID=UPI0036489493